MKWLFIDAVARTICSIGDKRMGWEFMNESVNKGGGVKNDKSMIKEYYTR